MLTNLKHIVSQTCDYSLFSQLPTFLQKCVLEHDNNTSAAALPMQEIFLHVFYIATFLLSPLSTNFIFLC